MTLIIAEATGKDQILSTQNYTDISTPVYISTPASKNFYIAAIPHEKEINSELIFQFNAEGFEYEEDLSY